MNAEAVNATIRVRPLRFGFVLKPNDRAALRRVIAVNTCLWGGIYNFIIPLFRQTPKRYKDRPFRSPTAKQLLDGFIEAFEPDFPVEAEAGLASHISFPAERVIGLDDLFRRDEYGRGGYGLTLFDVCAALYQDTFRFVQRHPQRVVVPQAADHGDDLLVAATFGAFTQTEPLAEFRRHFDGALDAKDETVTRESFFAIFGPNTLFPLRVGAHRLGWKPRRGYWPTDPKLFYMDPSSPIDIIEFWNFRALGWSIKPLPKPWAHQLKNECEAFLRESYRPYPPPSNAAQRGSFLCSKSCSFDDMRELVGTLKRDTPDQAVTIDPRFPRLWEEWGRNADHATRQDIAYTTETVIASDLGDYVSVPTILPDFVKESPYVSDHACVNVIESLPGAAAVMPLRIPEFHNTLLEFDPHQVWPGREGIIAARGPYDSTRMWKKPSPLAVFNAWLVRCGLKAELSSNGRIANQVIQALGGLRGVRVIANEEVLRLLQKMAHGDVEIEIEPDDPKRRRLVRGYAMPRPHLLEVLSRACASKEIGNTLLASLVRLKILVVGLRLQCPECRQTTWYRLMDLDASLRCERCLQVFDFPAADPPRDLWAYRVNGPFAIENFAQGAYSVGLALDFIHEQLADGTSWLPSVSLTGQGAKDLEADFALFLRPKAFSQIAEPFVIFGESKTFDRFKPKDISRMAQIGKRFPGAVLCFATLNQELTVIEKKAIGRLARKGRRSIRTGQQMNPVLVLTKTELLGRGDPHHLAERLPERFRGAVRGIFFAVISRRSATLHFRSIWEWSRFTSGGSRRRSDGGAKRQVARIAMPMRLGRNDPCWCGSGKKYKKCHLDRDKQEPARPWEVDAHIRARTKHGECLHVGTAAGTICAKPAIGSHTVPRKMLKQIARKGHVYYHSATIQDLEKGQGRIATKLIGVNDASVLPVFCQAHDTGTFAPLEQAEFTGDHEQCFLLAYRPLCHEYSKKRDALGSVPTMKAFDRGKPVQQQVGIQMTMDALAAGYKLALRDLDKHKLKFNSMLLSRNYSGIRAYIVTLQDIPEILCAGILYPECDFAGNALQDLGDTAKEMEMITFSLIATATGGAFVLAWENSSDAISRLLARSLDELTDADLPHAIVRFIFEFCENHYLKPEWWDRADQNVEDALTTRLQIAASAWEMRSATCVTDDGHRPVSWKVTGRTWL